MEKEQLTPSVPGDYDDYEDYDEGDGDAKTTEGTFTDGTQTIFRTNEGLTIRTTTIGNELMVEPDPAEIWNGSQRALLSTVLHTTKDTHRRICINLADVRYLPEGTFGLMFNVAEKIEIVLMHPTQEVRRMLWFTLFCEEIDIPEHFLMHTDHNAILDAGDEVGIGMETEDAPE